MSNQWKAWPAQATSALAVSSGSCLGGAGEHVDVGQHALDHRAQGGVGLDGDERAGEQRERARELARARGDVDDVGALAHAEVLEHARERLERPAGARRLVVLGDRAERERARSSLTRAPP